jgi:hypothetical protein
MWEDLCFSGGRPRVWTICGRLAARLSHQADHISGLRLDSEHFPRGNSEHYSSVASATDLNIMLSIGLEISKSRILEKR